MVVALESRIVGRHPADVDLAMLLVGDIGDHDVGRSFSLMCAEIAGDRRYHLSGIEPGDSGNRAGDRDA